MEKWRKRALLYKVVSMLPWADYLMDMVRSRLGGLKNFNVGHREYAIAEMIHLLRQAGKRVGGRCLAEIGSGWHPVLPMVFYALGARRVIMTDVHSHMRRVYVEQTLQHLLRRAEDVSKHVNRPASKLRESWNRLRPNNSAWAETWRERGIDYRAPFDFRRTGWPDGSVDMIFSNSCLGYIPTGHLRMIFAESARVLRRGGWIAHNISVDDDYSGTDGSINPLNFLRYSADEWARIGNSRLHYQNRRRPGYYIQLAGESGLQVVCAERLRLTIRQDMLDRAILDPEFRDLSEDELLCSHLLLVAEKRR